MKIAAILDILETVAPLSLQEAYDNAGLLTGDKEWECAGVLCTLDVTEAVLEEAIAKKCNLIVAHHPIIFAGLKKINGKNYVERTVIKAIKNDIAIYAIHTNLDNIKQGVNGKIASLLQLENQQILSAKTGLLRKLYTFVPEARAGQLRTALFTAGAGNIGNYDECSFNTAGMGTFRAGKNANPFVGKLEEQHQENEIKVEVVFPAWLEVKIVAALKEAHPYEEVAYDIITLANNYTATGSGLVGELPTPMAETDFLSFIKKTFGAGVVRHTRLSGKKIQKVAVCGGAGSFLISRALSVGADAFVTADMKYHEFFDADGRLLIADIGHYESEQFTSELLQAILLQKFPTFAVLKTDVNTNPVHYF